MTPTNPRIKHFALVAKAHAEKAESFASAGNYHAASKAKTLYLTACRQVRMHRVLAERERAGAAA